MKKLFTISLVLFSMLLVGVSCNDKEPTPNPRREKSTKNTFLLYLGTDNNSFHKEAWEKRDTIIKYWNSSYDGNMLVFADVSSRPGYDDYAHLIKVDEYVDTVKSYYNPDSSDPAFLREVLNDVKQMYPAEKMGMAVLSHALGWLPLKLYQTPSRSLIEDNGSYMELSAFADAIPYKLDYLIFDLCFMGGIEVAYELKDKADYIVSSPAEVVVPGFDYRKMMGRVFGSDNTESAMKGVAYDFYKFYADGYFTSPNEHANAATVSVVKTSELEQLAEVVRNNDIIPWAEYQRENVELIQNYHPTKFYYTDLGHFVNKKYGAESDEFAVFQQSLNKVVTEKYNTDHYYSALNRKANPIVYFSGLTFYMPRTSYPTLNEYYKGLKWYKAVYGD